MENKSIKNINSWPGLTARNKIFPLDVLKAIKNQILKAEFKKIHQEKESHYSHVFKSTSERVSQENEIYISNYYQACDLDTIEFLKKRIAPIIGREILKQNKNIKNIMIPQLMRFSSGSFLRMHVDDYAGESGYTIFINNGWKWDYGGILNFVSKDGYEALPIFPEDNLAIIRDESKKSFHYVSQQLSFSNSSQYLLVGWASNKISHEKFDYIPIRE